jgi:hypothetical protein
MLITAATLVVGPPAPAAIKIVQTNAAPEDTRNATIKERIFPVKLLSLTATASRLNFIVALFRSPSEIPSPPPSLEPSMAAEE